jgi:hypothetical protein
MELQRYAAHRGAVFDLHPMNDRSGRTGADAQEHGGRDDNQMLEQAHKKSISKK